MSPVLYSSIFGGLTKTVQVVIDETSRLNKKFFDTPIYERYMTWDTPSIKLNFEEIIGKYNLSIAEYIVDKNSKKSIRDLKELGDILARNLTHVHSFPLPEQEYRKILGLLSNNFIKDSQKRDELMKIMMNTVKDAVDGVQAKLDMIFLGSLSNEGIYNIDDSNNLESIKTSINYQMPDSNKGRATIEWTEANINTVDPFEDIQSIVAAAQNTKLAEIWISQARLSYLLKSKKFKQVIFGTDKRDSPLLITELNSFMERNGLPKFNVIQRQVAVRKSDGSIKTISLFNDKNLVFVPEGKLGVIKNSYTNNELMPEEGVTYSNYGRIRISQWGVGVKQNSNQTDFIKAETIALPVFNSINGIYSLKTEK